MSRRRNRNQSEKEPKKEMIFHQKNPPPGELAACGKLIYAENRDHSLIVDRDSVNCPDCLSRPDPTIVIR